MMSSYIVHHWLFFIDQLMLKK